jgi:hypothetical protein
MVTATPGSGHSSPFSVFAIDVAGYSRLPGWRQHEVRVDLAAILSRAAASAHLDRAGWITQDKGDGELALVPAKVPKAALVADYVRELVTELDRYNHSRNERGRIRVRVAFHHGEARVDGGGFPGDAPVIACRLLDSKAAREALRAIPEAHLVLILSDRMFEDTAAARERGLDPGRFRRAEVRQDKYQGIGWVTVPGFSTPDPPGAQRAAPGPAPPSPESPGGVSQVGHDQARMIGVSNGPVSMGDNSVTAEHVEAGDRPIRRRNLDERARRAPRK